MIGDEIDLIEPPKNLKRKRFDIQQEIAIMNSIKAVIYTMKIQGITASEFKIKFCDAMITMKVDLDKSWD